MPLAALLVAEICFAIEVHKVLAGDKNTKYFSKNSLTRQLNLSTGRYIHLCFQQPQ